MTLIVFSNILFAQQNNLAVENNQKLNRREKITNSKTKLDILQEVWERLLPLKKITYNGR